MREHRIVVSIFLISIFIFGVICGFLISQRIRSNLTTKDVSDTVYIQILNESSKNSSNKRIVKSNLDEDITKYNSDSKGRD